MKLSERLEELAVSVECDTYTHDEVALLREAAALARRVESADRAGPCMQTGSLLSATLPEGRHYKGQFLRLIPEVES